SDAAFCGAIQFAPVLSPRKSTANPAKCPRFAAYRQCSLSLFSFQRMSWRKSITSPRMERSIFGARSPVFWVALAGLILWGIRYATQDTLLKALIASVIPEGRRNSAFGIFYLGYGGGWLVGSVTTGLLYDYSRTALITFSILTQIAAVPFFLAAAKRTSN